MYNDYSDIFTGIGCFKDTFLLQNIDDLKPYLVPSRCVAYALQEPFTKELERLHEEQILAPLVVDETVEWYKSFIIVSKPKCTVCLCLDPMRLYQALIRPMHKKPTITDILPKVKDMSYMTLID